MDLDRLAERLSDPTLYPEPTETVEVVQTHISYIFLTDRYVYKVKKPVDFGFLDYTTLEKRRAMCDREVRLNNRLCPGTYVGVVEIRDDNGELSLDGPGVTVELAVKMVRLPAERMLRRVLERGEGKTEMFAGMARRLAEFHSSARLSPEDGRLKDLAGVKVNCDENFAQTERYVGELLSPRTFAFTRTSTDLFFQRHPHLFARRVAERRIVDGHGDLHLDSICLTEPVCMFDCIEFNERFRILDVAEEVAFLAMDLEFHGYTPFGRTFVEAYLEASGDRRLGDLLAFYKGYRAYVRAKVSSFQGDDPHVGEERRRSLRETASRYYQLANRYARTFNPQRLIITCGLAGSGKSTLARRLGQRHKVEVLRSDVVRKELLGLAPEQRRHVPFGEGEYAPSVTERTYWTLMERAEALLAEGRSVILDASFLGRQHRRWAVEAARRAQVPFLLLESRTSEKVIRERLEHRARKASSVSDGRMEIYEKQLEIFEPPDEFGGDQKVVVDRSRDVSELLGELDSVLPREWLDAPAPATVPLSPSS
jgi:aminoglycoside phosphotransferase family enzyme/predicted kinase